MRLLILAGFLFICTLAFSIPLANNSASEEPTQTVDSLQQGMIFLKKLTSQQGKWYFNNPEFKRSIKGLIHFLEDEQVDTVLFKISKYKNQAD